jgi:N-acetylglucosaminyldiphosphoundecaprenol N-acetyl-beta-D-mannosaminyltransferase
MSNKINMFGIDIDRLTMAESVQTIASWVSIDEYKSRYVVTPNVDHIVNLNSLANFKQAYSKASLIVADGNPVVWASKLLGKPLPETVPGSDLVPAIFDYYESADTKIKVYLLGAMPGVAETAANNIHQKWANVKVVGTYSPNFGFEKSQEESNYICNILNELKPDIVVFGVGSPKQELWAHQYADKISSKVILCVGATIDFLAGEKARAPFWIRRIGLEWLHRLVTEPKRLFKRYFIGIITFPKLVFIEWKKN